MRSQAQHGEELHLGGGAVSVHASTVPAENVAGVALLGVYMSTVEENVSKGALQLRVHPHGRFIEGQWIGEGYDHEFARGHVVFCRERSQLLKRMEHLIGNAIDFEFKSTEN